MRNRTLADLDRVVALGGGHGLGRVRRGAKEVI
ncbi:hypothetical protein LTSEBAI_1355, partial [Salmonella enterica subsp. enterica serovar Baildon str. R6-199]